jgi:hypothetical protein
MAKREVGIYFRAHDQASRQMRSLGLSTQTLTRQLMGLAKGGLAMAGIGGGLYGVVRIFRSLTEATMLQEKAERSLAAAVGMSTKHFEDYADAMQKRTVYGNEAILLEMAYGANLGITTDKLREATTAAMGLAERYQIDLRTAMMLVGRASQGQTQMLTRYGIILDDTATQEERFAQLLKIGADSFHLVEEAAATLEGRTQSLSERWGDIKKELGKPFAEAAVSSLERLIAAIEKTGEAVSQTSGFIQQTIEDATKPDVSLMPPAMGREMRRQPPLTLDPHAGPMRLTPSPAQLAEEALRQADIDAVDSLIRQYDPESRQEIMLQQFMRELPPGHTLALDRVVHGPPAPTEIDYEAFMDQLTQRTRDTTTEITSAWRRMSNDMTTSSQEAWDVRRRILEEERKKYEELFGEDSDLVPKWYREQKERLDIDKAIGGPKFMAGLGAGIEKMKLELPTLGKLGADIAETFRDGIVDSLADAVFEAKNLGDAFRELGRSMARMAAQWAMQQAVTTGMNALFAGGAEARVGHGGGRVGSLGTRRWVDSSVFAGAEVGHTGLAPRERPIIARDDEWLLTPEQMRAHRGDVAGERHDPEVRALLRELVDATRQQKLVVDPRPRLSPEDVLGVVADYRSRGGLI